VVGQVLAGPAGRIGVRRLPAMSARFPDHRRLRWTSSSSRCSRRSTSWSSPGSSGASRSPSTATAVRWSTPWPGSPTRTAAERSPPAPCSTTLDRQRRDRVPEHQQLSVLGCRSPRQQREPSHHRQNSRYSSRRVIRRSSWPDCLIDESAAQHPRPTFWDPQVDPNATRPGPRADSPERVIRAAATIS
jgi:hypothetical protein